ncbi:putative toxin [Tsukamurella strandjordii]
MWVTDVDPQWYFDAAISVRAVSTKLVQGLTDLQNNLNVDNSAGNHTSAGHTWATKYDQAASDVFEAISLTAMAADNLGELIHAAGAERVHVQNTNSPGRSDVEVPALPEGGGLTMSMHPRLRSTGGLDDPPENWDIVEKNITKKWADCDITKIKAAGESWMSSYRGIQDAQLSLSWTPNDSPDAPAEVAKINASVARIVAMLEKSTQWSIAIGHACNSVQATSDSTRQAITNFLAGMKIMIASLGTGGGGPAGQANEAIAKSRAKLDAAEWVRVELEKLDASVDSTVQAKFTFSSTQPSTGAETVTSAVGKYLTPLLGRNARSAVPVQGGNSRERGREGEIRAGENPDERAPAIFPNCPVGKPKFRIPDGRNDDTKQITEVKNVNKLSSRDRKQVIDEANWASENGYTMTLITDHRTVLSQDVNKLVSEGKITVLRMELDENLVCGPTNPTLPDPSPTNPAPVRSPDGVGPMGVPGR